MTFERWHPLDGNMIAADEHHEGQKESEVCPDCGEDLEKDDDGSFCPNCGFSD